MYATMPLLILFNNPLALQGPVCLNSQYWNCLLWPYLPCMWCITTCWVNSFHSLLRVGKEHAACWCKRNSQRLPLQLVCCWYASGFALWHHWSGSSGPCWQDQKISSLKAVLFVLGIKHAIWTNPVLTHHTLCLSEHFAWMPRPTP